MLDCMQCQQRDIVEMCVGKSEAGLQYWMGPIRTPQAPRNSTLPMDHLEWEHLVSTSVLGVLYVRMGGAQSN
jgi:hypothetical protein